MKDEINYLEKKLANLKERISSYEKDTNMKNNKTFKNMIEHRKKELKLLGNILNVLINYGTA